MQRSALKSRLEINACGLETHCHKQPHESPRCLHVHATNTVCLCAEIYSVDGAKTHYTACYYENIRLSGVVQAIQ